MRQTPTIPSAYIASGNDIRELFHLFLKAPVAMVIFKGPSLVIEYINEKTLEVLDRKREDVLGRPVFDCFPELRGSEIEKILASVFKKHEKFRGREFEASFYRYGKLDTAWFDLSAEPMQNTEGAITGVMAVLTEITEQVKNRKKIEESEAILRRTKEQLELSISVGRVGIWHWDVKNNVLTWSKEQFELFGVSPDEFEGKAENFFDYIIPEDRTRINAASRLEFEKSDNQYEFRIRRKDGTIRWIHSRSKTFLNKEGVAEYITGINIDITEQKTFSEKLAKEVAERTKELVDVNSQLNEAQQIAQIGSWELDYASGEVTWSDEMYSIYGYGDERFPVTLEKAMERMLPEELDATKERLRLHAANALKAFEEKGTVSYDIPASEYTIVLPGGTRKMLRGISKIIVAEDGVISKILGTIQDVTEQRKAEEDIRMMNTRLNEAQQIARLGSWDWNLLTGQLNWSDNLYNIHGIGANEEINYEKFASLVHADDRPYVQKLVEAALHTKQFHDFYHRIITPAGEVKTLHARGEVLVDNEGRVIGMRGTAQDVTQEKIAEDKLLETNKKLEERNRFVEKLINSSLDLIMVVDTELRLLTLNKKAKSIFNSVFEGDVLGRKITDINPGVINTEPFKDLLSAFEGNIIIRDKVKSTISENYYEHNYIPLTNQAGEVYAVMVISHDITESIRQMEELRKALEADKLKSDFIKMASHELKTPITSIKGYVQLLLAMVKEKEDEAGLSPLFVKSSLVNIEKQVGRLTRLMSELLDLSKIESGQLELNREEFSLNELVIDVVQDILYTNPKHGINIYHDSRSSVFADKDRIGQVLVNLLTNAIKYSPDADKIDVTIHQPEKNLVAVSVKDFGIGIDQKEQQRIFERFYRAEGAAEQTFPGFGIGLFIAKEMVIRHEGTITVKSEKGKGSVFTFTLPLATKMKT